MTVAIAAVRAATPKEWDDAWAHSPNATFSMSRAWAELWALESNGTMSTDARVVQFSDGPLAVLPLVASRQYKGLLRDYAMCAGGGYGAPLSADRLDVAHHRLLLKYLLSLRDIAWLTSPVDESSPMYAIEGADVQQTHLLALDGSMDDVMKSWSRGTRSSCNRARRAGVSVREARNVSDWQAYFRIYQDSLRRWGDRATSNYPWSVFSRLASGSADGARLWLAEAEGQAVAGMVCFYASRHVTYWHGASLEAAYDLRPVNGLMQFVIEQALASGHKWFDLGLSGGHEGVAAFKRGFGAEPVACYSVSRRAATSRLAKRVLSTVLGG